MYSEEEWAVQTAEFEEDQRQDMIEMRYIQAEVLRLECQRAASLAEYQRIATTQEDERTQQIRRLEDELRESQRRIEEHLQQQHWSEMHRLAEEQDILFQETQRAVHEIVIQQNVRLGILRQRHCQPHSSTLSCDSDDYSFNGELASAHAYGHPTSQEFYNDHQEQDHSEHDDDDDDNYDDGDGNDHYDDEDYNDRGDYDDDYDDY